MTVTNRKRPFHAEEVSSACSTLAACSPRPPSPPLFSRLLYYVNSPHPIAINEPGVQTECDGCLVDLTHSIRIKCADPACTVGEGVDLCPNCFCCGKEFGKHKRGHAYRVEVSNLCCGSRHTRLTIPGHLKELHSYPIFTEDWGADE
jgi:hypothetical protein